jgi:hypothetical protein
VSIDWTFGRLHWQKKLQCQIHEFWIWFRVFLNFRCRSLLRFGGIHFGSDSLITGLLHCKNGQSNSDIDNGGAGANKMGDGKFQSAHCLACDTFVYIGIWQFPTWLFYSVVGFRYLRLNNNILESESNKCSLYRVINKLVLRISRNTKFNEVYMKFR